MVEDELRYQMIMQAEQEQASNVQNKMAAEKQVQKVIKKRITSLLGGASHDQIEKLANAVSNNASGLYDKLLNAFREGHNKDFKRRMTVMGGVSQASLMRGITKDFASMMRYHGSNTDVTANPAEAIRDQRRKSITKLEKIEEEQVSKRMSLKEKQSSPEASPPRKTNAALLAMASLYSSNDEDDGWDKDKIKSEMKKLSDFEIDPKEIEDIVKRV